MTKIGKWWERLTGIEAAKAEAKATIGFYQATSMQDQRAYRELEKRSLGTVDVDEYGRTPHGNRQWRVIVTCDPAMMFESGFGPQDLQRFIQRSIFQAASEFRKAQEAPAR